MPGQFILNLNVHYGPSTCLRLPEIQPNVKFLFKEFCAAIRVPQIFSRIPSRMHLQTHRSLLK